MPVLNIKSQPDLVHGDPAQTSLQEHGLLSNPIRIGGQGQCQDWAS